MENYNEANTRFLLENNNWSGLVIDSSQENIEYIKSQKFYWKYKLIAECNFINKININKILEQNKNNRSNRFTFDRHRW